MFVNVSGWERAVQEKLFPWLWNTGMFRAIILFPNMFWIFIAQVYFPVKAQVQLIEICSLKLKDAKIQGDRFISLI